MINKFNRSVLGVWAVRKILRSINIPLKPRLDVEDIIINDKVHGIVVIKTETKEAYFGIDVHSTVVVKDKTSQLDIKGFSKKLYIEDVIAVVTDEEFEARLAESEKRIKMNKVKNAKSVISFYIQEKEEMKIVQLPLNTLGTYIDKDFVHLGNKSSYIVINGEVSVEKFRTYLKGLIPSWVPIVKSSTASNIQNTFKAGYTAGWYDY